MCVMKTEAERAATLGPFIAAPGSCCFQWPPENPFRSLGHPRMDGQPSQPYAAGAADETWTLVAPSLKPLNPVVLQRRHDSREDVNGRRVTAPGGPQARLMLPDLPPWPVVSQETGCWSLGGASGTSVHDLRSPPPVPCP